MNRKLTRLLWISLALVLVGSLIAWNTQTAGGTVRVIDVRWVGSNGTPMSGLLYVPQTATAETPAPGIVAIHGYINSRETQSGYAIEFARRGWVVLAADQTGHGFSGGAAFANGFGGPDALRYLRSLDIVDPDNIGLEGHSMGGWASLIAAGQFPDDYKAVMLQGSSTGTFGAPEGTPDWPRNLGLVFSQYDEFSGLMWGSPTARGIVETDKLQALFNTTEPVEVGRMYGSVEDGTARMLYQPAVTHPGDHLSTEAIGNAVDWFQRTLEGGAGASLPPSDQIWPWKEFGTLLALIGLVMSFFPIGGLLLENTPFRLLTDRLPEPRPVTGWGWWLAAVLTAAIPALTFFPFNHLADADRLFGWTPNALFPQNLTTGIMFWAVGNALITLVLFLLWHFLANRKNGASFENYGAAWRRGLRWGEIWRSFVLAALIAFAGYLILALMDFLFKVDFRFWVVALKPMSPLHFRIFLGYLIPFALYFLILGLALHGQMRRTSSTRRVAVTGESRRPAERRKDRDARRAIEQDGDTIPLWQAMLINVALLVTGIIILLLVQYIGLFTRGMLTNPAEPLLSIVAIQFVPILAIVALISTYFFRKTGKIYVGAFLNAIFVTWYIVAGQATHFPF
jgi:pimeloyl-ACP methyl ester carboxylesterase